MDAGIAAIDLDLAAVPKATISVETDRSNGSPRRGCRVRGRSRPVTHSDGRYRLPTLTQPGSWSWVQSDCRPRRSASIARRRVVSSWAMAVMWLSPLAPSIIRPSPSTLLRSARRTTSMPGAREGSETSCSGTASWRADYRAFPNLPHAPPRRSILLPWPPLSARAPSHRGKLARW
jgi:hypothetical protein